MKGSFTVLTAAVCAAVFTSSLFSAPVSAGTQRTRYEAESAELTGVSVVSENGFSGGRYAMIEDDGCCTFEVNVSADGFYDIELVSSGIGSAKYNDLSVDGSVVGQFSSDNEKLTHSTISSVYLTRGTHIIDVTPSWGWIKLDYMELSYTDTDTASIYNVKSELSNPNATKTTRKLMKYIVSNYGKNVLAGQQCEGMDSDEYRAIKAATGKEPAVMGLDLMRYSSSRVSRHDMECKTVEQAKEFSKAGGIVTICWHWNAPDKFIKKGNDEDGNPNWWGGFYTDHVTGMDLSAIMDDPNSEDYKLLVKDIDIIAGKLAELQKADVPVLFRPLHEASGGWFWWGSDGADAYIKLYRLMYTRLTKYHKLNNLIWVWNGQDKEWYPGDKYVDIIGEDIYPDEHQYGPQSSKFLEAANTSKTHKVVTLSENGCLFDIDKAKQAGTLWSWFCVWGGEFCVDNGKLSGKYTEKAMWKKVYGHNNVITLDELDWR